MRCMRCLCTRRGHLFDRRLQYGSCEDSFCAILFDDMQARQLMKTHVVKTSPDASLAEAVDLMDIYQVNSMPVVDTEGKLCGFLSEQEIVCAASVLMEPPHISVQSMGATDRTKLSDTIANTPVANVMQLDVVSIFEDDSVAESLRNFFVNDFTRIPVLSLDGHVVGTLNRIDIVQAMFEKTLTVPEG